MAESASHERTPLIREHISEKRGSDPYLKWEKWAIQLELALLAKENITLNTLLGPQPEEVQL